MRCVDLMDILRNNEIVELKWVIDFAKRNTSYKLPKEKILCFVFNSTSGMSIAHGSGVWQA